MAQAEDTDETVPDGASENPSFGSVILTVVAAVLGGIVSGLITGALQAPWYVSLGAVGLCLILAGLYAFYWLLIRSAKSEIKRDRQEYLNFRKTLEEGGAVGWFYDNRVKSLLGLSERIYGDAGVDAPTWTRQSFDRSLRIATVYPLILMIVFWAATGNVDLAGKAMGLPEDRDWYWRALVPASWLPMIIYAIWRTSQPKPVQDGWKDTFLFVVAGAGAFAGAFAVAVAVAFAGAFAVAGAVAVAGAFAGAGVGAFAGAFAVAGAVAIFLMAIILHSRLPDKWASALIALLLAAILLIGLPWLYGFNAANWQGAAALALFLPLLTLTNAPFDWLSLGITRKFMRMGLGKANWQPLLYSFLDLFLALTCLVALGAAMILVIQTFNARLIMEGGASIYDPAEVLRGIANPETRWESQYWWIYATLFSTFIPSLLNLIVGSLAIVRGIAPVNGWVLKQLPERAAVTQVSVWTVPLVLAFMRTVTIALAASALVGIVYVLAVWVLPFFGVNLLEVLTALADANWPMRILIG